MSGVLLSVAFYAILRVKVISDMALGTGFARTLLLITSLASLALATVLLIGQRDYKRMLAYSSIEHMGLLALGAAIGSPLAMAAVMLHILGHALAKTVAFLSAGHLHLATGSSRIDAVHGLAARSPLLAGTFGGALLALLAFPPFSLFASELGLARAGFTAGLGWAVSIALLLILLILASITVRAATMLPGPATDTEPLTLARTTTLALMLGLLTCAALGVTDWPLHTLLQHAAAITGAPR